MKQRNLWLPLVLLAALLSGIVPRAGAAPTLDPGQTGSLTVMVLDSQTGRPVPGGRISLYRIARVTDALTYETEPDYADCGLDLKELDAMTAAQNAEKSRLLEEHIRTRQLKAQDSAVPDEAGQVRFEKLPLGLYLVVQTAAASRHEAIAPFLVTVPQREDAANQYVYDVDAAPKTGTAAPETTAPTTPAAPGSKLPQTGQLWWPVYVMGGGGMALFTLGWHCRRKHNA